MASIVINRASDAMRFMKNFCVSTAAEATHQCLAGLSGGKFRLTQQQELDLWSIIRAEMYPEQLNPEDERAPLYMNYLIEKPPADPLVPRPPYFDFDFHLLEDLPVDQFLHEILRPIMSEVVGKLFPDLDSWTLRAVVSTASSKKREKEVNVEGEAERCKVELIKRGYHILFPEMLLTKNDAAAIRLCVVRVLKEKHGERYCRISQPDGRVLLIDTWENIVDPTVFSANGLRMLGSHKVEKCKNHQKGGCKTCNGFGRVDEGRPYSICAIVGGRGELVDEKAPEGSVERKLAERWATVNNNFAAALQENTIHREGEALKPKFEEGGFKFGGDERKSITSVLVKTGGDSAQKIYDHTSHLPGIYFASLKSKDAKPFIVVRKRTEALDKMELFLRDSFGGAGNWRFKRDGVSTGKSLWDEMGGKLAQLDIYVPGVYNRDERQKRAVRYSNTFPEFRAVPVVNFCPNVGRSHSSNRVYFYGYYNKKSGMYEVTPNCFSINPVPNREPCRNSKMFFRTLQSTMPVAVAKWLLIAAEIPNLDTSGATMMSLRAPEASEGAPPPELAKLMSSPSSGAAPLETPLDSDTYSRSKRKALEELHVKIEKPCINLCYGCHLPLTVRDKALRECKCETPQLVPYYFVCGACNLPHHRKKSERNKCTCEVAVYNK